MITLLTEVKGHFNKKKTTAAAFEMYCLMETIPFLSFSIHALFMSYSIHVYPVSQYCVTST